MSRTDNREERGLLDTNVLIRLSEVEKEKRPLELFISTVTLAELSVGPLVATSDAERAARQAHLQLAEADFDPLPFDVEAAREFWQGGSHTQKLGTEDDGSYV